MCGIVGYVGKNKAVPFLLQGLEKLEYRGYDSSGIAVFTNDGIKIEKKQGRLKILADAISTKEDLNNANLGIGHTRWATHGAPNDVNAHPHKSKSGKIAVVHNGIIENYAVLKAELIKNNVFFTSETDSEVVVNLIEREYLACGDVLRAISSTVKMLRRRGRIINIRTTSKTIMSISNICLTT